MVMTIREMIKPDSIKKTLHKCLTLPSDKYYTNPTNTYIYLTFLCVNC